MLIHMNTKVTRWSPDQIMILASQYEALGPKALEPVLGKNLKSISKKARSLGLSRGISAGNKSRANSWSFTRWTYDLGYIAGAYLGDGNLYIEPNQTAYFKLEVIDRDFCEAIATKVERETGYTGSLLPGQRDGFWCYRLCNRDFVYWLRDEFGGPNQKRIKLLPDLEANKGMVEGLYDSEGSINRMSFELRMSGNLQPVQTTFQQLGVLHRSNHTGIRDETWQSPDFKGYSVSNREYTRVGLGTYIKRKAINGLSYREHCWSEE